MLKLRTQQETWHEIFPGVRVLFRPITRNAWRAARRAAGRVLAEGGGGDEAESPDDLVEDAGDEISHELLYRGIADWEGVVGDDEQPLAPTLDTIERDGEGNVVRVVPGTISQFLADPILFTACDQAYVLPFVNREREKKGSSPSPSGTSAGEMRAGATASSAAPQKPARGAKSAPTKSTSPRRRKGRSSGK